VAQLEQVDWSYDLPKLKGPPGLGLDGFCLLMTQDGWRGAMVGTMAFFDKSGDRQHTVYPAEAPGYGRAKFLARLGAKIGKAKLKFPDARYVGLADGAGGTGSTWGGTDRCTWWTSGMRRGP
jgi:hypothetical protein